MKLVANIELTPTVEEADVLRRPSCTAVATLATLI
jgi:hypothetical protein